MCRCSWYIATVSLIALHRILSADVAPKDMAIDANRLHLLPSGVSVWQVPDACDIGAYAPPGGLSLFFTERQLQFNPEAVARQALMAHILSLGKAS